MESDSKKIGESNPQEAKYCQSGSSSIGGMVIDFKEESDSPGGFDQHEVKVLGNWSEAARIARESWAYSLCFIFFKIIVLILGFSSEESLGRS